MEITSAIVSSACFDGWHLGGPHRCLLCSIGKAQPEQSPNAANENVDAESGVAASSEPATKSLSSSDADTEPDPKLSSDLVTKSSSISKAEPVTDAPEHACNASVPVVKVDLAGAYSGTSCKDKTCVDNCSHVFRKCSSYV